MCASFVLMTAPCTVPHTCPQTCVHCTGDSASYLPPNTCALFVLLTVSHTCSLNLCASFVLVWSEILHKQWFYLILIKLYNQSWGCFVSMVLKVNFVRLAKKQLIFSSYERQSKSMCFSQKYIFLLNLNIKTILFILSSLRSRSMAAQNNLTKNLWRFNFCENILKFHAKMFFLSASFEIVIYTVYKVNFGTNYIYII